MNKIFTKGTIDGQNKGEERDGAIETIEQQSMKRNEYVLNNVMLLEIPLWRS